MLSFLTLSGLLVLFADPAAADEPDEDTRRLEFMKESVVGYQIRSEAGEPIELYAEPVLRWNNPVSGVKDGIIAMWTLDGRPAVLGQVFQAKSGTWLHEFQSVAETPIAAARPGPWRSSS